MRLGRLPGSASGLVFNPTGPAKLFVSDSTISGNGTGGYNGGITIKPASGIHADVSIVRTQIDNNYYGIFADGTGGGIIHGVVRDSTVSGNANNGITVTTTTASVILLIDNTTVAGNNYGLVAGGPNAGFSVGRSSIVFNNTGLFSGSGGVLGSYKNNNLGGNGTDGAFTVSGGLQ